MIERDGVKRFLRTCDRRTFLKAFGSATAGIAAGGVLADVFDVWPLGGGLERVSRTRVLMGTYVTLTVVDDSRGRAQQAIGKAFDEMDRLIAILSRHDSRSALSLLNDRGAIEAPPRELVDVVRGAVVCFHELGGAFDVTVAPVVDLYKASFSNGHAPSNAEVHSALELVSTDFLHVSERRIRFERSGMRATLDGIAKGYIVDRAAGVLDAEGAGNYVINAGGDIRTKGARENGGAWRIAVESPEAGKAYPVVLAMNDGCVATSGNYELSYDADRKFQHIVDPATGVSPGGNASVTVRAHTAMRADALATAVMVFPVDRGVEIIERINGAGCLIVDENGSQWTSGGFERT